MATTNLRGKKKEKFNSEENMSISAKQGGEKVHFLKKTTQFLCDKI